MVKYVYSYLFQICVGIPAVSHFHRPQGVALVKRQPNLPDHTFPLTSDCKLVPAGYMPLRLKPLRRRCRSESPEKKPKFERFRRRRSLSPKRNVLSEHSFFDTSNRERIRMPRIGELHIFLHAARFFKNTSSRHASNLLQFLPSETTACGRRVLILITDGGSDWNTNSLLNIFVFGKLWTRLKLDALILVRYAPGHSKYNPIERRWAPLTKKLSQVRTVKLISSYKIRF